MRFDMELKWWISSVTGLIGSQEVDKGELCVSCLGALTNL